MPSWEVDGWKVWQESGKLQPQNYNAFSANIYAPTDLNISAKNGKYLDRNILKNIYEYIRDTQGKDISNIKTVRKCETQGDLQRPLLNWHTDTHL